MDYRILLFAAVSDYKQSLQFQNLNEVKRNIKLDVRTILVVTVIPSCCLNLFL